MTTRVAERSSEAWLSAGVVLVVLAAVALTTSQGFAATAATAHRLTGWFDASVASACLDVLGLVVKIAVALR